jgi:hypothetical protein
MNSFPIHKLTLVSCIISFICFIAFSSHSHVHAVTPACIVTSNVFDLTGTLTSTGTGPLVYSQTLTGYEYTGTGTSPSSIASFNISAHNTATIAAYQGITVSAGFLNITNINGTVGDTLYSTYTGTANATTGIGVIYGRIIGGSGKFVGAQGTYFSNGTIHTTPVNNGQSQTGNGIFSTVLTVVLP